MVYPRATSAYIAPRVMPFSICCSSRDGSMFMTALPDYDDSVLVEVRPFGVSAGNTTRSAVRRPHSAHSISYPSTNFVARPDHPEGSLRFLVGSYRFPRVREDFPKDL